MNRIRTARLPATVALALAVAACGTPGTTEGPVSDTHVVELPVWGDADEDGPAALTHGVLEGDPDEGCVWLVEGLEEGEDLDAAMTLMWREGHVFDTSTMDVLDPDGDPVASVGDEVTLGGGEVPHFEPDRCEVSDRVWIVSSVGAS